MAGKQRVNKVYSCFLEGITGIIAEIEVSITPGIPTFDIIGLCDSSIRESRGRIQAALRSSGYDVPKGHITVSISPAYMKKSGSNMDLPIALGILMSSGQIKLPTGAKIFAEGELSLVGTVKETPGAALRLQAIRKYGGLESFTHIFIPQGELLAAQINNMTLQMVSDIRQVCESIIYYRPEDHELNYYYSTEKTHYIEQLKGQEKAKRAIIIAAAGFHNILLLGSPGSGKSMAATMIKDLMPPLSSREAGMAYAISESNGKIDSNYKLGSRPFRFVQPNITTAALLGKGITMAPGEVTLANNGILFADEILEFPAGTIDLLRTPMETREVKLIHENQSYMYPANFLFVGTGNPCRCGYFIDGAKKCRCTPVGRKRYFSKLTGPFLDRIDLFAELRTPDRKAMENMIEDTYAFEYQAESQSYYREKVYWAWEMQKERFGFFEEFDKPRIFNATVDKVETDVFRVSSDVVNHASQIAEKTGYTGRGFSKLLRVGRTIADLERSDDLLKEHISEAAIFRTRTLE